MGVAFHKKTSKEYIPFSVRLEADILEGVREIANKEDMSINEIINQGLRFVIEDYNKNNKK